jgi:hypothetical protein
VHGQFVTLAIRSVLVLLFLPFSALDKVLDFRRLRCMGNLFCTELIASHRRGSQVEARSARRWASRKIRGSTPCKANCPGRGPAGVHRRALARLFYVGLTHGSVSHCKPDVALIPHHPIIMDRSTPDICSAAIRSASSSKSPRGKAAPAVLAQRRPPRTPVVLVDHNLFTSTSGMKPEARPSPK